MPKEINYSDDAVYDKAWKAGLEQQYLTNRVKFINLVNSVANEAISSSEVREQIFQEELEKRSNVDETREVNRKEFNELSALVDEVVWCLAKSKYPMQVGIKTQDRAEFLQKRKQIAELHDKIKRLENEG